MRIGKVAGWLGWVALGACVGSSAQTAGTAAPGAQTTRTPPPQAMGATFQFQQTVRRVLEDVVVTDGHGNPISGLTQGDFVLTEDGVPQQILSFEAHTAEPASAVAPPTMPAGTYINLPAQADRGPLYILVDDMIHTAQGNELYARQQLLKFVQNKPEGTRFAIFALSDGVHLIQGFTSDKAQLTAALDPTGKTLHMPKAFLHGRDDGENYLQDNPQALALAEIAEYVVGLPGRKNVVWMSDGLQLPLFPALGTPQQRRAAEVLLSMLADEHIALYPIDTIGVGGSGFAASRPGAGLAMSTKYQLQDAIAGATGGRAYYSDNDFVDMLEKATAAGQIYYSLSYESTNRNYNDAFRKIAVKLQKKGYQLQYRPGYYGHPQGGGSTAKAAVTSAAIVAAAETAAPAPAAAAPVAPAPPDTLAVWIRHGMPMSHEVVFVVQVRREGTQHLASAEEMATLAQNPAYFQTRQREKVTVAAAPVPVQLVTIAYAAPARQFAQMPGRSQAATDTLEFVAAAYDRDGLLMNGIIAHATPVRADAPKAYRAEQQFDVPAGAAWLCVAVRDALTGRIGSLEIPLTAVGIGN